MKNIYLYLVLAFSFWTLSASAQTALAPPPPSPEADTCGTPDPTEDEYQAYKWYGDTLYLDHYYDSLLVTHGGGNNYRTVVGGVEPVWLRIPIQFWVYTEGATPAPNHERFPTEADFQRLIDNVNEGYRNNGIPVRFYMLCPRFVNDPDAVTINNATEGYLLIANNKVYGSVNVHICQNTTNLYNPFADGILISRSTFVPRFNQIPAASLTHEIGHYFGLQHTFFGSKIPCQREPVSRGYVWRPFCPQNLFPKTCAVTGDFLPDTEADHEDIPDGDIDANCVYTGTRTDFWGQRFRPNGRNYMAYHPSRCRGLFTPQQRSVMLNNMYARRTLQLVSGGWTQGGTAAEFDRWEPDNAASTSRLLPLDEAQIHSMQGRGCGPDTEDWLRFVVPGTGETASYILEIRDVPGYNNPVATAEVFTSAVDGTTNLLVTDAPFGLTLLSNTNGVRRWLLPCNALNGQAGRTLLIRLASANGALGRYQVTLERNLPTLLGPTVLCRTASEAYSVDGLLPNAVVTWSITPTSVATLSTTTGATTTVTGQSQGLATLTVSISSNGCVTTLPPRSINVTNSGFVTLQPSPAGEDVCISTVVTVYATSNAGGVVTNWRVDNGQLLSTSGSEASVQVSSSPGTTTVYADYDSSCPGSTGATASASFYVVDNKDGFYCVAMRTGAQVVAVYPNPADAYVDIRSPFAAARPYRIELYNDRGRRGHGETARASAVRVDTHSLPTGLYHLTLRQGNQTFNYNLSIQH